jgi:hypothetical protein
VSPLGTISSGVWNGSTIPVAYGGTGVTSSSGANSVVLRDANQNVTFNNFTAGFAATTASAAVTVLTVASARNQVLVGSTTHTFQMPNATTLQIGQSFIFVNNSSGVLTITNNAGATVDTVPSGGAVQLGATSIATSAGTFGIYSFLPGSYNFNNTTADFGGASVVDAVWNGTTIASGYGGTGLTTFAAANNALYSTSSSALAAGTLPIAAGGTSATTAAGAFNALNPMTTTGDLIYEASASTAARLPIGTSGQVLSVSGGIPAWAAPPGSTTLTTTSFTATSGQTTFTVTYTPALLQGVYRNGIKLDPADYTSSSGTAIVLATGAITGDNIQVQFFSSLATSTAVNSISFGSTGLTPATASTGEVTVAGTLAVANGGTGSTTLTTNNVILGNGTSAVQFVAPSTSGNILTSNGTTWVSSTPTPASNAYTRTSFTATASQTTFTVTYTVGLIEVYVNGVLLNGSDYTATSGTNVVLAVGCNSGDIVETIAFSSFSVAGTIAVGNGGTGLTASGSSGNVLTSNGSTWVSSAPTGGGVSWQSVQTANFAASAGKAYPVNTTSGAITVTFPASAAAGDLITILDYAGTFNTNNLSINLNGLAMNGSTGLTAVISIKRASVNYVYTNSTQGWVVYADSTSIPFGLTYSASYLVVGGGGGGGLFGGGGGGAGGMLTGTTTLTSGTTYTATIGTGGTSVTGGSAQTGGNGGNSSFSTITATGGGGGGGTNGSAGGSGGGAGLSGSGGAGTSGQGNNGGSASGGGGGAGAAGTGSSGVGGIGLQSSITGTAVYYAGGGGGAASGTNQAGGLGGGGQSGQDGQNATAGTANTGGGGGGCWNSATSGVGGSGVVIISVPTSAYTGTTTGSPTVTTSGSNTIIKFTSSGSYTA